MKRKNLIIKFKNANMLEFGTSKDMEVLFQFFCLACLNNNEYKVKNVGLMVYFKFSLLLIVNSFFFF